MTADVAICSFCFHELCGKKYVENRIKALQAALGIPESPMICVNASGPDLHQHALIRLDAIEKANLHIATFQGALAMNEDHVTNKESEYSPLGNHITAKNNILALSNKRQHVSPNLHYDTMLTPPTKVRKIQQMQKATYPEKLFMVNLKWKSWPDDKRNIVAFAKLAVKGFYNHPSVCSKMEGALHNILACVAVMLALMHTQWMAIFGHPDDTSSVADMLELHMHPLGQYKLREKVLQMLADLQDDQM